MLTVTRERLFPHPSKTMEGSANLRAVGVYFGQCVFDTNITASPRLLLVRELVCHLHNQRSIFSEVLLYDHRQNNSTTLLSSLPSASRILSAAISPDGSLLAISTVTRDWGSRYQYTTTVTSLKRPGITASIRLRSPADVCFPGDSSHLLLLTYVPILAKVFVKRTRLQTQQLILRPLIDPLHVFGEVLHVQSSPPYVLTIELPATTTKYTDIDGMRHMYARMLTQLDTRGATQILVLRLYRWHNDQLNEIRRLPVTIPARYKVHPFPSRGSIQCKSVLIDLVTTPQPVAIFSCHSLGCTLIKVCACLTASIFTFSLASPLQNSTEETAKKLSQDKASNGRRPSTEQTFTYHPYHEYIIASLHKYILLAHANYLLFIQPFSLIAAQLVIVALPLYKPMHIAYSALIPFQICNLQTYCALKKFSKLPQVSSYISQHSLQAQYLLHYMALSLINMSREQILADMYAVRTTMDRAIEYTRSSLSGSGSYSDTPFGFISYTDLAKVYMHKRIRHVAGLPEAPKISTETLYGWSGIDKDEYLGLEMDLSHPALLLSSLIKLALNEITSGTNTVVKTSSKTTDSNPYPKNQQDISATNFSTSQRFAGQACIPSAMHTCQTDYTDERHRIGSLVTPPVISPSSTLTDLNLVYSETHSANNSPDDFLNSTVIASVADTSAFDEADEQPSQKRSRYKEVSANTIILKQKPLFPQIHGRNKRKKHLADPDNSAASVISKKSTSSKIVTQPTTVIEPKSPEHKPLENDSVSLSLELAYLGMPISGSINFPMHSSVDMNELLKYIPQPKHALHLKKIDEVCHLSKSWRYSVIPSYYSSTEEWSKEVTFSIFDMLLQRQLDLTVDLSQVSISLCYPSNHVSKCLYEARLLRLNHKLVSLYYRYAQLVCINLLAITSDVNISSSSASKLHDLHVRWWERTLKNLRAHCILEYTVLVLCLLEKVSTSLQAISPNKLDAIQFSSAAFKTLLLTSQIANDSYPRSLAINLYSNPLHVFLHSVAQDKIMIESPWSRCTTMYAAHAYLHISNATTTSAAEQCEASQQNIPVYDQSIAQNIRFGAGRTIDLYNYMSTDSICPTYVNNYAQECFAELNQYVSNISTLATITPCLSNFSRLITQPLDNQLSIEDDTGGFVDKIVLHAPDDLDPEQDNGDYKHIWCNSAIYKAFMAIVGPLYPDVAASFFKQLCADVIFMCEACIGIDTNFSVEELSLIISICESCNLSLTGHKSTSRVFKRALSLLYDRFPDPTLQEMLAEYL